ncbi:hypothetical protein BC833DRAFT_571162 [Globomyces pollinis-pini]|nr:hypothetical protein BC833DRAFT_571162 [Globomyces pollinis-pini]
MTIAQRSLKSITENTWNPIVVDEPIRESKTRYLVNWSPLKENNDLVNMEFEDWDDEKRLILFKLLEEYNCKSSPLITGLKNIDAILPEFNRITGLNWNNHKIQTQIYSIKEMYSVLLKLDANPKFTWDDKLGLFRASEEDWHEMISENKEVKKFKTKTTLFKQIDHLFKSLNVDMAVPKITRPNRIKWCDEHKLILIKTLQQHKDTKKKNVYRWSIICDIFNELTSSNFNQTQLKSQFNQMKIQYFSIKAMKENSLFQWDSTLNLPVATDAVWKDWLLSHKECAPLRYKPVTLYRELAELFEESSVVLSKELTVTPKKPFCWVTFLRLLSDRLSESFTDYITAFKLACSGYNSLFNSRVRWKQMEGKLEQLKEHFIMFKCLQSSNDFSFNSRTALFEATDQVWTDCITYHNDFQLFKEQSCNQFFEIEKSFKEMESKFPDNPYLFLQSYQSGLNTTSQQEDELNIHEVLLNLSKGQYEEPLVPEIDSNSLEICEVLLEMGVESISHPQCSITEIHTKNMLEFSAGLSTSDAQPKMEMKHSACDDIQKGRKKIKLETIDVNQPLCDSRLNSSSFEDTKDKKTVEREIEYDLALFLTDPERFELDSLGESLKSNFGKRETV